MSPEFFDPEIQDCSPTKYSDCYALGMVIYEVLSGHVPFYKFSNLVIPGMIFGGKRPSRPEGSEGVWFRDDVWTVLEHCWTSQPNDRPGVEEVLQCLEEASRVWMSPSPQAIASPSTSDSPASNLLDIRAGLDADWGGVSSLSQVPPPRPSEKSPPKSDADEALDRQDLGTYGSDLGGSAGVVNGVSLATFLGMMGSENSLRGRQEVRTIHPLCWSTLGHVMWWMQAEASIISCCKQTFMVLLLAVGKAISREIQQPETPGATPRPPAVTTGRSLPAAIFLKIITDWDGNFQGISQVLTLAFEADGYLDCIKDLKAQGIDPLSYINSLDTVCSYSILHQHI